ncbi:MAG: hypothetical protein V4819_11125 [Verrucomicrobiota bacterium]
MSLLPQHKKSADEIAKLRESLGIVAPPPAVEEVAAEIPVTAAASEPLTVEPASETMEIPATAKLADIPTANHLPHQPVDESHRLKEVSPFQPVEKVPVLAVEENGPPPHSTHPPDAEPVHAAPTIPAHHAPKIVRSLRKSEQVPLAPVHSPAVDSKLPIHRHSDKELTEIRRHDSIATLAPWTHPQALTANLALVVPGYLFAIAGAVCFYFYDVEKHEMRITAACAAIALFFAAFIFFKKPLSRHHAAFIGVAALFVIVFGALYYFPQLRHGT